jgi:hypothetical protein
LDFAKAIFQSLQKRTRRLISFWISANRCTADVQRLGGMKGSAGLAAFLKQQRWENLF